MVIENKVIELLDGTRDMGNANSFRISNSIIKTFNLVGIELTYPLIVENCIIHNFNIHSCWFNKGVRFANNHVLNYVDYQMGGHNEEKICISGNIFSNFVNFFDCQFEAQLELRENIFTKGTNLLGNKGEGFENMFRDEPLLRDNIGSLDINGMGWD